MNQYMTFTLDELKAIIADACLECFSAPAVCNTEEVREINSQIAMHNEGIRSVATSLFDRLEVKYEKTDEEGD